jgi:hypothetical protein
MPKAITEVASNNLAGLLLNTVFLVRTTKMINSSVIVDSKNHPV